MVVAELFHLMIELISKWNTDIIVNPNRIQNIFLMLKMKKHVVTAACLLALLMLIGTTASRLHDERNHSPLITAINEYERNAGQIGQKDITHLVKDHLEIGMPIEMATGYFESMDFEVHQSWDDKTKFVADYRFGNWPFSKQIVTNYRFILHTKNGLLTGFEGKSYTETP